MLQKIKNYIIIALAVSGLSAPALVPVAAFALNPGCTNTTQSGIAEGVNDATGSGANCEATSGTDSLQTIAAKIVNVLSIIVGVVAVIMVIFGGLRYITSGGESGNVSSAKNTLIYAVIGLIIVALAQFLVHYVLNTATGVVGS